MFRKIVLGSSTIFLAAAPLVGAPPPEGKVEEVPAEQKQQNKLVCRPSELPIYPTPSSTVTKLDLDEESEFEKKLMEPIRVVRSTVVSTVHQAKSLAHQVNQTASNTADQFSFIVAYLREEDNEAQRIGATAMGTLTGFIFGLRGGIFKRVTYSLLGTTAMGTICYPEEASQYYDMALTQGKLLTSIVYNFVMGVKPGDPEPPQILPDITIPSSFSEMFDMANNFMKSKKEKAVNISEEKIKESKE